MSNTDAQVLDLFKTTARELSGKEFPNVAPDTVFAELGLDSVVTMEILGAIESKLGMRFPDESLATMKSVGELMALVKRLEGS